MKWWLVALCIMLLVAPAIAYDQSMFPDQVSYYTYLESTNISSDTMVSYMMDEYEGSVFLTENPDVTRVYYDSSDILRLNSETQGTIADINVVDVHQDLMTMVEVVNITTYDTEWIYGTDDFTARYDKVSGSDVKSIDVKVLRTSYKARENAKMGDVYDKRNKTYYQDVIGYETVYDRVDEAIPVSEIYSQPAHTTYTYEITYYKEKAQIGYQSVLVIPTIMGVECPELSWWSTSWTKRAPITITNPKTIDGYQANFTLTYDADMMANFSDIRFVDYGDGAIIPHYIEFFTASTSANVWLRLPKTNATIYMYYGRSTATSTSSNVSVFDLWDDFNDASFNTSKWNVLGTPTVTETAGSLYTVMRSSSTDAVISDTLYASTRGGGDGGGWLLEGRVRPSGGTETGTWGFGDDSSVKNKSSYMLYSSGANTYALRNRVQSAYNNSAPTNNGTAWGSWQLIMNRSGSFFYTTPYVLDRWVSNAPNGTTMNVSLNTAIGDGYTLGMVIDWIRLRRWDPPVPTFSVGAEESPTVAPVAQFSCTPQNLYARGLITCTDGSTNSPTSWKWNIDMYGYTGGLGRQSSTAQNPTFMFDLPGNYTINMTATNAGGSDSENKSDYALFHGNYTVAGRIRTGVSASNAEIDIFDYPRIIFGSAFATTNVYGIEQNKSSWSGARLYNASVYTPTTNSIFVNKTTDERIITATPQMAVGSYAVISINTSGFGQPGVTTQLLTSSTGYTQLACAAANNSGSPAILVADDTSMKYLWKNGNIWNIDTIATPGRNYAGCDLAFNSSDIPHIIFSNLTSYPISNVDKLVYGYKDSDGWHTKNITWGYRPQIAITSDDTIYISYIDATSSSLYFLSKNLTSGWSNTTLNLGSGWLIPYETFSDANSYPHNIVWNYTIKYGAYDIYDIFKNNSGWNYMNITYWVTPSYTKINSALNSTYPNTTHFVYGQYPSYDIIYSNYTFIMGDPPVELPVAAFSCTPNYGVDADGIEVSLPTACTDASTNTPTNWYWEATNTTDGIKYTSTAQNPAFRLGMAGLYNVNMSATNADGTDWENKTDYLIAYNQPMWKFNFTPNGTPYYANLSTDVRFVDMSYTNHTQSSNINYWNWYFWDNTTLNIEDYTHCVDVNCDGDWGQTLVGNHSIIQNKTNRYPKTGWYNITFEIGDASGETWEYGNVTDDGSLWGGNPAYILANHIHIINNTPNFTWEASPLTGIAPLTVTFTEASNQTIENWTWLMGDGFIDRNQTPTHIYKTVGHFTVCASVMNYENEVWFNRTSYIYATPPQPTAAFSCAPRIGTSHLDTTCTDASTESPTSYYWSVENGSVSMTSTVKNPIFNFTFAGLYNINMSATNPFGSDWENKSEYIIVNNTAPVPAVTLNTTTQYKNYGINVSGITSIGTNLTSSSYYWAFEDATTAATMNYTKTFTTAGIYFINLSVTDSPNTFWNRTNWLNGTKVIITNQMPVAIATMNVTTQIKNGAINLSSITSTGDNITAWYWLVDGTTQTTQNWTKTFATTGSYTINLSVIDSDTSPWNLSSLWDNSSMVYIINDTPSVSWHSDVVTGVVPFNVQFTDDTTGDGVIGYNWTFGDGGSSQHTSPLYAYTTAGAYNVTHNVSTIEYEQDFWFNKSYRIIAFDPTPTNSWSVNTTAQLLGGAINFTDGSTYTNISLTNGFYWMFGDLTTASTKNSTHIYGAAGVYSINHSITESVGTLWNNTVWLNRSNYINIIELNADFTGVPTEGAKPLTVVFTDTSTGTPTSWSWTFGDGGVSNLQNPTHIYVNSGIYTVTLTIGKIGLFDTETKVNYISVVVTDFGANKWGGCVPLTIEFTDTSVGAVSWDWNFGDGSDHSNLQNPTHIYTAPGPFTVKLTTTTAGGIVGTYTHQVTPQQCGAWTPAIPGVYNITPHNEVDWFNSTFTVDWLPNLSGDVGDFKLFGLIKDEVKPLVNVWGWYLFALIYGTYILVVWIRSQSLVIPIVIGLISLPLAGMLFPIDTMGLIASIVVIGIAIMLAYIQRGD